MTVEKKDIDWGSLGFGYMKTDYSYEAHWKDGEWDEGGLTTDHTLHVSECGGIFHYCQEVFEGLKACWLAAWQAMRIPPLTCRARLSGLSVWRPTMVSLSRWALSM